mmetsp:Transcript_87812/g.253237  ORF Transcript_87812/g.253237 Transcript_87812/m.253237 type:complete len:464 (-) Transcript_87812:296-1687(-)
MALLGVLVCSMFSGAHAVRLAEQHLEGERRFVGGGSSAMVFPTADRHPSVQPALELDVPARPWAPPGVHRKQGRLAATLSDAVPEPLEGDSTLNAKLVHMLPLSWVDKFAGFREARPGDRLDRGAVISADLAIDPSFTATLRIERSDGARTHRESIAAKRLAIYRADGAISAANVLHYYKFADEGDKTFFLTEAMDSTLEEFVSKLQFPEEDEQVLREMMLLQASTDPSNGRGAPLAPNVSLPILIDLLRGCQDLETAGLLHSQLSMQNVLVSDGRAVIGGLGDCCASNSGSGFAEVRDSRIQRVATVFVQAPEIEDSVPTGPKNHVWSLGLIFARMTLGLDPILRSVVTEAPGFPKVLGRPRKSKKAKKVREIIRHIFDIHQVPGFQSLHPEMQRLLRGMLQKDPRNRWSTGITLEQAQKAAVAISVQVPPARKPKSLPKGAWDPSPHALAFGPELLEDSWQ